MSTFLFHLRRTLRKYLQNGGLLEKPDTQNLQDFAEPVESKAQAVWSKATPKPSFRHSFRAVRMRTATKSA